MDRFDPDHLDLAAEFQACPFGHHSVELQSLLRVMRTEPEHGKHALYCIEPYRRWALARVWVDGRNRRIEVLWDRVFDSRELAEWAVFKARWERLAGRPLALEGEPPCRDRDPAGGVLYGRV